MFRVCNEGDAVASGAALEFARCRAGPVVTSGCGGTPVTVLRRCIGGFRKVADTETVTVPIAGAKGGGGALATFFALPVCNKLDEEEEEGDDGPCIIMSVPMLRTGTVSAVFDRHRCGDAGLELDEMIFVVGGPGEEGIVGVSDSVVAVVEVPFSNWSMPSLEFTPTVEPGGFVGSIGKNTATDGASASS